MKITTGFDAFKSILIRDITLGLRNQSDFVNPLIFFIIVITMFPLSIGPEQETLRQLAPAIVWVAAVLASSLSLDGLFRTDFEDGSLEQILLSPHSSMLLISAKIFSHWLLSGLPLLLLVIMSGSLLYLPITGIKTLLITLLLGTPVLSLVGAIAGALTMGLRNSGMLQALLTLPLLLPLLIFSVSAVNNALKGLSISGEFYFLGAILVLALTLAPLAVLSALRIRLG
ncbi:MAG: heme exporter protein CcmB [Gammaproteobacteria bacterium]|jgi:heme exporter protein B